MQNVNLRLPFVQFRVLRVYKWSTCDNMDVGFTALSHLSPDNLMGPWDSL